MLTDGYASIVDTKPSRSVDIIEAESLNIGSFKYVH